MTPAELQLYARAWAERSKAEQETAQVNLYSLAALIRPMIWAKHPPSYERAFPAQTPEPQAQTDDEMYAMVRGLNALFGGEEVS